MSVGAFCGNIAFAQKIYAPTATVKWNDHNYYFYDAEMTWHEAKEYCESIGGYLATFTSEDEWRAVQTQIKEKGKHYWFGAYGKGSIDTWIWITGEEWVYSDWCPNEPNNDFDGTENYLGTYTGSYQWNDYKPEVALGFVCEMGTPDKDAKTIANGHTYQLFDTSMTWHEAKAYCEALGGHLVTITSADEQHIVEDLVAKGENTLYWLGATDSETEGEWKWITGEKWNYTNWGAGEPNNQINEDCAFMIRNEFYALTKGEWNDTPETTKCGLICEWDNTDAAVTGFSVARDGWSIDNINSGFSYSYDYTYPAKRYYEVCDDISATIYAAAFGVMSAFGSYWGGNCFGLSASAVLNYTGDINLKDYFKSAQGGLNGYGYDYINYSNSYCLNNDSEATALIERMQISQFTNQFDSAEVFRTGDHKEKFKKLIDYLNGDDPVPLVVAMHSKNGSGHALVTDTTSKPIKQADGFYAIYLYDCNMPYNSIRSEENEIPHDLNDFYDKTYLYVNPTTGEWKYCDKPFIDWWISDNKNYFFAGDSRLRFYDVTKYSDKFIKNSLTLKPSSGKTALFSSGNQLTLKTLDSDYTITKDGITSNGNIEYKPYLGDNEATESGKYFGKFIVDSGDIVVSGMDDVEAVYLSHDNTISITTDNNSTYTVNAEENKVTLNASENAEFDIVLGNDNNEDYSLIKLNGTADGGKVTLTLDDNGIVNVDGELENLSAIVTAEADGKSPASFACTDIELLSGYSVTEQTAKTEFDSPVSVWAKEEVEEAYSEKLIPEVLVGKDLTKKVDRAEFAAIAVTLYESLSGKKAESAENPFTDISDNACMEDILKAYNLNITAGTSATTFDPTTNISREQMATMLARAYKKSEFEGWTLANDADYPLNFMGVKKFDDDSEISDYAKESVYFMARWEIIKGVGDNKFAPKHSESLGDSYGFATREQAIIIALRSAKHL